MREVRIRDTLSGEVQRLEPGPEGEVGIYACGPTTYGPIHIGNARPYVIFSLLRRFLAHEGYAPTLVINLTDVNDKIYDAAREEGVPSAAYAERMIAAYTADTDALGIGRPDHEPRATETIGPIVALIADLIASGHAYESAGDVYFRVRSFPAYGQLSNRDPEAMDQGEEAGSAELKEDPLDFALWKARKGEEDTAWPSPWGEGARAGTSSARRWPRSCSGWSSRSTAAARTSSSPITRTSSPRPKRRGSARWRGSGCTTGWSGPRRGGSEKMAKSVGNVFLLGEAIRAHGAEAVVGYLVSGHYRQPIAFGDGALAEAAARNQRIREFFREGDDPPGDPDPAALGRREAFLDALADDFNTPRALAELFGLLADARREPIAGARAVAAELLELLGLESLAAGERDGGGDEEAERLLTEREKARADRDFARADEIRERLGELGWEVRDTSEGARLVRLGT